ncbi:hypothetical protein FHR90_003264 [Endobacter medicaginis]|uniref:Uncharacterized protein n=1 Tax=Endobacter medicaginis TaxID=1181271 RepID=A0A850NIW2_9PROT|nr:hypothetical protein [Endobacter medicaginis]MBB3175409.1 hypothetical protein [Endobacter medicaginis]MCX5476886.1 hypothetical protein [Endobacter medicaginis]NVN29573.1 hypothetical protein [Endobacter medicaginis]
MSAADGRISLGRDSQVIVIGPFGQIEFSVVTSFNSKQSTKTIHVDPLSGPPLEQHVPAGWTGELAVERADSAADDLFSNMESSFWSNGLLPLSTLFHYVNEPNGGSSIYKYNNVAMHLSDGGTWKSDSSVAQRIAFFASTREKVQ